MLLETLSAGNFINYTCPQVIPNFLFRMFLKPLWANNKKSMSTSKTSDFYVDNPFKNYKVKLEDHKEVCVFDIII